MLPSEQKLYIRTLQEQSNAQLWEIDLTFSTITKRDENIRPCDGLGGAAVNKPKTKKVYTRCFALGYRFGASPA